MKKTKTTPVAMQFKRPRDGQAARFKQQKHKTKQKVEIMRPWTTPQYEELSKEERDIVLDRLQKEVADVPFTCSHAVQGVNQVAKAVARGELRVVVFANNPESLVFGHLPLLCRLHQVPICVLHLSSKTFGRLFALKSMVAIGIRSPKLKENETMTSCEKQYVTGMTATDITSFATVVRKKRFKQVTEGEVEKLVSITDFLISKASCRR
ncbi:hypothetical protein DD238_007889 [Peronospora effusa]|uniref:Ribosomal protein eL8/eL30/eS12/Gadd45 domain-containing protein n=1 Tax=Peronospora effusa TaxID=542832 RepID=A0A3M6V7L3_9STRA|nr:hypothetical protein DD238_007889 [Peronospora effusa]RQM09291.1 hypothetical protein DD237_003526 [Peronospora effusa]